MALADCVIISLRASSRSGRTSRSSVRRWAGVPFAISCPSTHPIVTSLHGRTTSVHLSLRSALQGEDLASLKQGAVLKKGVWIAYPYIEVEPAPEVARGFVRTQYRPSE